MANQNRAVQDTASVDTSTAGLFGHNGIFGSDYGEASSAWENQLAADDGDNQDDHDADDREVDTGREKTPDNVDEFEDDDVDPDDEDTDDDSEDEADEEDEDDQDEDDDDDQAPAELDPSAKVKVKVDGEEVEVTVDELRQGYSRTQDYTRKTQQLAEERKTIETSKQELDQELGNWRQAMSQVQQYLKAQIDGRSEQEWTALKEQDPYRYYEERDKQRQLQERLTAAQQADQEAQQEQQRLQSENMQRYREEQLDQLKAKVPDWVDPEVAKRDQGEIMEFGQSIGFTAEELNGIMDHRAIVVLRNAAKYAKLQESRKKGKGAEKVTTRSKKPLKPGTPSKTPAKSAKRRKSAQRLQRSGSVNDAAQYFESFLDE